MRTALRVSLALAAFALVIVMTPAPAPAGSIKDQRMQGASSVQCKSGKMVRHAKACKENGGKF